MAQKHWIMKGSDGVEGLEHGVEEVLRWARGYIESLEDRGVNPEMRWGEVLGTLEESPPMDGQGLSAIGEMIEEADREFVSRLVHWQSPRFFAYFPCSGSVPAVIGELMSAVLNVNGMLWSTSPACTELEVRVMDWCAQMFGLDDVFRFDRSQSGGGCIQGTASEAAVAAMVAARRQCTRRGVDRSLVTVYTSDQAHSSVVKAAMVCGLADHAEDKSRVRVLETDSDLRIDPEVLRAAMQQDVDDGLVPMMVVATAGSTSTGAVDPIGSIAGVLGEFGNGGVDGAKPWLHVDAAWAGAACVCPEFQDVIDGHEFADSICINPHKWLLTNFDCDLFWVRDRDVLTESMSITPAYLRDKASDDGAVDYRDWHVALGRRMRSLKLWFVIRCFGIEGLREHIRGHVELAEHFERWVVTDDRVELSCERMLGLVSFHVLGETGLTKDLVEWVNSRGRVMITHSLIPSFDGRRRLDEKRSIARVSVGTPGVGEADIKILIEEIGLGLDHVLAGT